MSEYRNKIPFASDPIENSIYVSYSYKDKEEIFPIITDLYKSGWPIWYKEGIEYGENWKAIMNYRIGSCTMYLLFITENSDEYIGFINSEIITAQNLGKDIVICILYEDFDFEKKFAALNYIAASNINFPKIKCDDLEEYLNKVQCLKKGGPREAKAIELNICEKIEIENNENLYEYEYCEDGISLTKYLGGSNSGRIIIPSEYPCDSGNPVVELKGTFNHCFDSIAPGEIIIPHTVKRICEKTFFGYMLPYSITVPPSVERISRNGIALDDMTGYEIDSCDRIIEITCAPGTESMELISEGCHGLNIHFHYDLSMAVIDEEEKIYIPKGNYAFFCYNHEIKSEMTKLMDYLIENKCNIVDCENIGDNDIKRIIRKCGCFVANTSESYFDSIQGDLTYLALAYNKNMILAETLGGIRSPKDIRENFLFGKVKYRDSEGFSKQLLSWISRNNCRAFL